MTAVDAVAPRSRRATLATVAQAAGVSVATVSKVLNGRRDVAASTRALVQDALREHGHVAPAPRPVSEARTTSIEVSVDGDLHAYGAEVVQGVVEAGAAEGVDVVVTLRLGRSETPEPPGVWARRLAAAGRRAVITVTSELTSPYFAAAARAGLPVVVIDPLNMPRARVTSVGSTNFSGGLTATQHLIGLGHTRIGYVGGPLAAACNQARMHGFRAAMEAAGLEVRPGYIWSRGQFVYEDGVLGGAELLDLDEPPTAIFAGSDEMALGVIEAARARGISVPADLSLVGFDDTQLARMGSPRLTTVRQPLREMATVAVRTALRMARGETLETHHVELATELVVRDSTAPLDGSAAGRAATGA